MSETLRHSRSKKAAAKPAPKKRSTRTTKRAATRTTKKKPAAKRVASKTVSKRTPQRTTQAAAKKTHTPVRSPLQPGKLRQWHHVLRQAVPLPYDIHQVAVTTARVSGVSFVIIGALFTWHFAQLVFTANTTNTGQSATVLRSTTTIDQEDGLTTVASATTSAAAAPTAYLKINQVEPLQGTVTVRAIAPNARQVNFYVFADAWTHKRLLGSGTQVSADVWEYKLDTTSIPNGENYRFSAAVWDVSPVTERRDYDLQLLHYYEINNATAATTTTTNTPAAPNISLRSTAASDGAQKIVVTTDPVDQVQLRAQNIDTKARYTIAGVTSDATGTHWSAEWGTGALPNGSYQVWAQVTKADHTYTSSELAITIDHPDQSPDAITTDAQATSTEASVPLKLPALLPPGANVFHGTVSLYVSAAHAQYVNLYIDDVAAATPRFIGAATKPSAGADWYLNWYTPNVPNGTYRLFARAVTPYGRMESEPVQIKVDNSSVIRDLSPDDSKKIERINDAVKALSTTDTETNSQSLHSETKPGDSQEHNTSLQTRTTESQTNASTSFATYIAPYQADLRAELNRLAAAIRSHDESAQNRVMQRLKELETRIINRYSTLRDDATNRAAFQDAFAKYQAHFVAQVNATDTYITKRAGADVFKDSDKDGISDFDEVTIYHTDPFSADTDGDGIIDGVEIMDGYDPLNSKRQAPVTFASPQTSGVVRSDILSVDSVTPVTATTTASSTAGAATSSAEAIPNAGATKAVAVFAGKALPNSFVTLYIYSTPIVVTVRTDSEGSWRYRFDKELEDGNHEIYVGITDNAGRIIAKSKPFAFVKRADAITPAAAAGLTAPTNQPTNDALLDTPMLYLIVAISVVAIGLVLILLSLHLDNRRRYGYVDTSPSAPASV